MNETEFSSEPIQHSEQEKSDLYGEVLLKEATSLLAQYLPDALPKGPTEILFDIAPAYLGKFKDKHYIAGEKIVISRNLQERVAQSNERQQEYMKKFEEETNEFLRLLTENAEKGIYDEDLENKVFSSQPIEPLPEPEKEDWEEPERLHQGRDRYSLDTWRGIYVLVHELIHQKQAELNPKAFPNLSSPELDNIDPTNIQKKSLQGFLTQAHKAYSRTMDNNSLFYPVVEGMAVVGSFYVMSRLAADLARDGQVDIAERVKHIRNKGARLELSESQGDQNYDSNYLEGFRIMRKLYKQVGIENAPRLLTEVDLEACRGITRTSPRYQQLSENPALLPGLQQVA